MGLKASDLDKVGLLTLVQMEYFLDGLPLFRRLRPVVPRKGDVVDLGNKNPVPGKGCLVIAVIWKEDDPGAPQTIQVLLKSPTQEAANGPATSGT